MHTIQFEGYEWDAAKAETNLRKHGVDFIHAVCALEDDDALTVRDDLSAIDEQRFVTLGHDDRGRVLVVCYAWRGDRIRVISARRAVSRERAQYRAERS